MAFFTNKLSNRKSLRRKILKSDVKLDEDETNDNMITLKLGDTETTFYNGEWTPQTGAIGETTKENITLRQHISQLEEENNLLKLKNEILLDMVSSRPQF